MRAPAVMPETATLEEVLKLMVANKCNSVTVVNSEGKYVGLVSTNDIIRAVLPDYLEEDASAAHIATESMLKEDTTRARSLMVKDFMQKNAPTISVDTGLVEAAVVAAHHGHGRINVVDSDNKPVGILTRTELKRILAAYLGIPDN